MKSSNNKKIPGNLISSRAENQSINRRTSLSIYDERTFEQMLASWMVAKGYNPDNDILLFLEQTDLARFFSVDDWRSLLTGEKAPSRALANHLAVVLEHEAEELQPDLPSFITFRHRAVHAFSKASRNKQPILELEDGLYPKLRKSLIDKLFIIPFSKEVIPVQKDEISLEEDDKERLDAFTAKVIAYIKKIHPQSDDNQILDQLAAYWKQWPKEDVIDLLRHVDTHADDADLNAWAEYALDQGKAEPENNGPTTGGLLRFFRHCAGLTLTELGKQLGCNYETVYRWENNTVLIPATRLSAIKNALRIADEEFAYLLELQGSIPDSKWLDAQPDKVKAGVQLQALRETAGLKRSVLAQRIDVSPLTVKKWEDGDSSINKHKLTLLYKTLKPPVDAMCQLTCLVRKDMNAENVARELQNGNPDYLSFPALNPAWLAAQPAEKQAGLYVADYRQNRKLSQSDVGKHIGVTKATIQLWESGSYIIPQEWLLPLKNALALNEKQYLHFMEVRQRGISTSHSMYEQEKAMFQNLLFDAFPAFDPAWLDQQPREKRDGLLLAAYREYRGLSQEELARRIAVPLSQLDDWEKGVRPLDCMKLPAVKKELPLTETEYHRLDRFGSLLLAYRTSRDMPQHILATKLKGTATPNGITVSNWETEARSLSDGRKIRHIQSALKLDDTDYKRLLWARFPAFNPAWLREQPEEARAGLLLSSFRILKGLSEEELGKRLRVSVPAINGWEIGRNPIPINKLSELYMALPLSDDEAVYFLSHVKSDFTEQWIQKHLNHGTIECFSFPAFDDEWLNKQPDAKQAGLLLKAYRERGNVLQESLAQALNVNRSLIASFENSSKSITHARTEQCVAFLNNLPEAAGWFDAQEANRFRALCENSNKAIRAQQSIKKVHSASLGCKLSPAEQRGTPLLSRDKPQSIYL